jgi:hypothetical protein
MYFDDTQKKGFGSNYLCNEVNVLNGLLWAYLAGVMTSSFHHFTTPAGIQCTCRVDVYLPSFNSTLEFAFDPTPNII